MYALYFSKTFVSVYFVMKRQKKVPEFNGIMCILGQLESASEGRRFTGWESYAARSNNKTVAGIGAISLADWPSEGEGDSMPGS